MIYHPHGWSSPTMFLVKVFSLHQPFLVQFWLTFFSQVLSIDHFIFQNLFLLLLQLLSLLIWLILCTCTPLNFVHVLLNDNSILFFICCFCHLSLYYFSSVFQIISAILKSFVLPFFIQLPRMISLFCLLKWLLMPLNLILYIYIYIYRISFKQIVFLSWICALSLSSNIFSYSKSHLVLLWVLILKLILVCHH